MCQEQRAESRRQRLEREAEMGEGRESSDLSAATRNVFCFLLSSQFHSLLPPVAHRSVQRYRPSSRSPLELSSFFGAIDRKERTERRPNEEWSANQKEGHPFDDLHLSI